MINSPFSPNFFFYLLILTFAYFLTYIIGKIAAIFIPEIQNPCKPIENIFNHLILGFVVIVSIFAIVWTKGNSIFLISIFIFGFYFYNRSKEKKSKMVLIIPTKSEFLTFFCVFMLLFLLYILSYYMFFIRSNGEIWSDNLFTSNISNALSKSHIESPSIFLDSTSANLYHFSEIWFTTFFSTLFGINHLYVLILITYSFLYALAILGGVSIAQIFYKGYLLPMFLGIYLLFFKPFVAIFIHFIEPIGVTPKLVVVVVLLVFSILQYLKKDYTLAFTSLLLLVPFYSPIAPGILSGLFGLIVCLKYSLYRLQIKTFVNFYTIACFLVFLFFVLFYFLQNLIPNNQDPIQKILIHENPLNWTSLFIIKRTSQVLILFTPISIFFAYHYFLNKNKVPVLYWGLIIFAVVGVFVSSIIGGIVANYVIDGPQICTNFTGPVVTVIVYTLIIYFLSLSMYKIVLPAVILATIFYIVLVFNGKPQAPFPVSSNKPDEKEFEFYSQVRKDLQKSSNYNFGYFRNYNAEYYKDPHYTLLGLFLPLNKLAHIVPSGYYAPYCLSVFSIPNETDPNWNPIKQSHLWKYVQKQKIENNFFSIEASILGFIRENHVDFIIIEKYAETPNYILRNATLINEYDGNRLFKTTYVK